MPSRLSLGRPIPCTYTLERGSAVICRLSSGRSLRAVCQDPDMPASSTVHAWARKYPDFGAGIDAVRDRASGSRRSPGNAKRHTYTPQLGRRIAAALSEGFPLSEICRNPAVPVAPPQVRHWARRYPEFGVLYAAAIAPRRTGRGLRFGHGRRFTFDPAIAARIIERLLQGRTLTDIAADPDIPHVHVIAGWRQRHRAFDLEMQQARRFQLDLIMDALLETRDRPGTAPPVRYLAAALHRVGYLPFAANLTPPPAAQPVTPARAPRRRPGPAAPGIGHNSRRA